MVKINLYDWSAAELIHSYITDHFDEFCKANEESDVSELEYCDKYFADFKDWASALGYDVYRKE